VQLWDIATGKLRHAMKIDRPRAQVHAVAFAPDGKTIAVACGMSFFHVFDAESGRELRRFAGRNGLTSVLQFSADGKLLMAGSRTGTVQAWHTADGKRLTLSPGPSCQVAALAAGGNDQIIAAGYTTQGVLCWDARVGITGQHTGHQAAVLGVTFAADGQTVTSASADGSVLRWEAASGKLLKRIGVMDDVLRRGPDPNVRLTTLALSPAGRYAATNSIHPNTVRLWDLGSGQPACDFEASKPSGTFGVAFSPRGDRLATAGLMKQVTIWDVETGQEAASLAYDKAGNLMSRGAPRIVFAPDGKAVAVALTTVDGMTGAPQGQVLLLDATTGKERFGVSTPPAINGAATPPSVAFSVDGKVLALPGPNGSVALVHADSGKEWKRLETPGGFTEITALAFSPDDRTLAFAHGGQRVLGPLGETGSTAALVEVWELASGQRRVAFQGQQGAINCLAFAPDGLTLASGSADTTIILWDVASTNGHKTVATLEAAWATLAKRDAAAAFVAQARLRASPEATVALLTRLLRPVKAAAVDPKQLAASVANLDSEDFTARAQAFQALEQLGAIAEAALRKGRAGKISLEMRRRIDDLLDKIARGNLTAEELQAVRAVEVLERIRTAPARALLGALVNGEESAVLTREAQRALKRH
jgi:WD40 repeat protein